MGSDPEPVSMREAPNPHHTNQVWHAELTHVRPWPAPDLYGVLRMVGFRQVDVYRQFHCCGGRRRLILPLQKLVCRLIEMDYAQGLVVVAMK